MLWDDAVRCTARFFSICLSKPPKRILQVLLFLPWLASDVAASLPASSASHGTALCLGEGKIALLRSLVCHTEPISVFSCFAGTGPVGCGMLHTFAFRCILWKKECLNRLMSVISSRIIVSDLPSLLPLLQCNSILNNSFCSNDSKLVPRAIDWSDPNAYEDLQAGCRFGTVIYRQTITHTTYQRHHRL